ncbi:MAG TPA: hypothetical protein VHX61_12450 [Rhizomicrobium sp.]|jgi:hypothetical protein|nr:hypothetical protein [Rhizomicrobium sp.]
MHPAQVGVASGKTGGKPDRLFAIAASGILLGYVVSLAMLLHRHHWILQPDGRPVPCDFLAYWASGLLTLSGKAGSA